MVKDLKISGSGKSFTASCVVEREDHEKENGMPPVVTSHTMKGKDLQTALSFLKDEVCTTGKEFEQFDAMAAVIIADYKKAHDGK